jgi:hypothetical protein
VTLASVTFDLDVQGSESRRLEVGEARPLVSPGRELDQGRPQVRLAPVLQPSTPPDRQQTGGRIEGTRAAQPLGVIGRHVGRCSAPPANEETILYRAVASPTEERTVDDFGDGGAALLKRHGWPPRP